MKIPGFLSFGVIVLASPFSRAQVPVTFGKVSAEDFVVPTSPVVDNSATAVILSRVGSTSFVGNEWHWFSYVYKESVRIKIMDDRALNAATVRLRLYGEAKSKDKLTDVKATTYNNDNGKVEVASLQPGEIFEDKLSSYTSLMKFTLPAVRKGSIIEYSYTITSYHAYTIPEWYFQHSEYPCLYSEYKVVFPNALRYLTVRYGIDSFVVNKSSVIKNNRYVMGDLTVLSNDIMNVWIMKDIPAFTRETYIGSPSDYRDKIEFFLAQAYNGENVEDVGATWKSVTDQLLDAHYFGAAIDKDNSANLLNTAEKVTAGDKDANDIARHLFYYVRDNFSSFQDDEIYIANDLYDVNKRKKGSVAEINLLLTALLRQKNLRADPVILSTRGYGKNPPDYPVLDKMNYVICMLRIGLDTIYLDASRPNLGFGCLSLDCYNGHGRVISKEGGPVYLLAEKIHEPKNTNVIIYNNQREKLSGSFTAFYGTFGSEEIRNAVKEAGQSKYFEKLKAEVVGANTIVNPGIDSLTKPDFPATIHFDFDIASSGDILYVNPVVLSDFSKNPFRAGQRKYPVLLPYPIDDMYTMNMEIPSGYVIDELPKSAKVSFNGEEGFFEYLIQADQSRIQFRSHIKLNEITFSAADYSSLRDFFAFIIKKYTEQIVFKRQNSSGVSKQ